MLFSVICTIFFFLRKYLTLVNSVLREEKNWRADEAMRPSREWGFYHSWPMILTVREFYHWENWLCIAHYRWSNHEPSGSQRPGLNLVSVSWSDWEYYYSLLDGIQSIAKRFPPPPPTPQPSILSPVPIYTPGWRETMWSKRFLFKETTRQLRPSDWKSNALTTTPRLHFNSYSFRTSTIAFNFLP